jgi:class 3 adenylate cyclase
MSRIPVDELAELVPTSVGDIGRLEELAVLTRGEDGLFDVSDVHIVRLMAAFEDAGIPLEDVARGIEAGQLQFPLGMFMPAPAPRGETFEQLGQRLGRAPELLRRLSSELGFPASSDDRLRAQDAEMLALVLTTLDLADDDDLSRFARLYGASVQRMVASGLQFFDRVVLQRVATFDATSEEKDRLIYERATGYTELVSRLVPWLQGRHRERSVLEYLVNVTEHFMEERGIRPPQPRQPPAIAFLDLTGYTTLADERGDEAAAAAASELAGVVQERALAHGGRPVKWLGDGVMFHFADPGRAILSGLELVEQTEAAISLPARMGINAGSVIVQEGDYFGRTVNIASRIADYAQPHEVVVSEDAKQFAADDGVSFELIGDVALKGVSRAVRLHRATRSA